MVIKFNSFLFLSFFCGFLAAEEIDFLPFNMTPHSAEVLFIQPQYISENASYATYFNLGNKQQAISKSIKNLNNIGINFQLPSVKQMSFSEQLPYVIAPSANREFGHYLLAIPEFAQFPISVSASTGNSIFNLTNLVLEGTPTMPLSDHIALTTWWDQEQTFSELNLKLYSFKYEEGTDSLSLEYRCELTAPIKMGIDLLTNAKQSYLKQLLISSDCKR